MKSTVTIAFLMAVMLKGNNYHNINTLKISRYIAKMWLTFTLAALFPG